VERERIHNKLNIRHSWMQSSLLYSNEKSSFPYLFLEYGGVRNERLDREKKRIVILKTI
jgi:hypothetical protein